MTKNPYTKTGSYYPLPEDLGLCYHLLSLTGLRDRGESDFRNIWESGSLDSARKRGKSGGGLESLDCIAGDDDYMFLTLATPAAWISDTGYAFGFNAFELIDQLDAVVGMTDLLGAYEILMFDITKELNNPGWYSKYSNERDISKWPNVLRDTYLATVRGFQQEMRLEDEVASGWVELAMRGQPLLQETIDGFQDIRTRYNIPMQEMKTPKSTDAAELLVTHTLDLEQYCTCVIYRKIFFWIEDFEYVTNRPIGSRLPIYTGQDPKTGFPYRCPICGDPYLLGLEDDFFSRVSNLPRSQCESCGKPWDYLRG